MTDTTTPEIKEWSEPPARHKGRPEPEMAEWKPVTEELQEHTGKWALVHEGPRYPHSGEVASRIRSGIGPFAPRGSYQASERRTGDVLRVWARYIGEPEGDAEECAA